MTLNGHPMEISEILAEMIAVAPRSHCDSQMKLGQRIKEVRVQRGLSQRQLAFPGCSAAYISRLEAGERRPSIQMLHRLAWRLYVPTAYLSHGCGNPCDPPTEAIRALAGNDKVAHRKMTELSVAMRAALVQAGRL